LKAALGRLHTLGGKYLPQWLHRTLGTVLFYYGRAIRSTGVSSPLRLLWRRGSHVLPELSLILLLSVTVLVGPVLVSLRGTPIDNLSTASTVESAETLPTTSDAQSLIDSTVIVKSNVNVFNTFQASDRWATSPDGYLLTNHQRSYFKHLSPPDNASEPFTLHIEYLDEGPSEFALAGFDSAAPSGAPVWLATVSIEHTSSWKTIDMFIEEQARFTDRFFFTANVTIRSLEFRRYDLQGVGISVSSEDTQSQWILRPDGYLETAVPNACISLTSPNETSNDRTLHITYLNEGNWDDLTAEVLPEVAEVCPAGLQENQLVRSIMVTTSDAQS